MLLELVTVMVAVQAADIRAVHEAVSLPVLAQSVDDVGLGAHTGSVLVESVKENGAAGSLLNHSECRLSAATVKNALGRLRAHDLLGVVCAKNAAEAKKFDGGEYRADFIALEPPALIGGRVSVSSARPALIGSVARALKTPLIVGAGVHEAQDVCVALALGAKGVLVSSDILLAKDPRKELMELLSGFETPVNLSKRPV